MQFGDSLSTFPARAIDQMIDGASII